MRGARIHARHAGPRPSRSPSGHATPSSARAGLSLLLAALVLAPGLGCDCSEEAEAGLVEGDEPYVRAQLLTPPRARDFAILDGRRVVIEEGRVSIGGEQPVSVQAYAVGPGFGTEEGDRIPEGGVQLVFGGFARSEPDARVFLDGLVAALGEEGVAFLLPGGEDDANIWRAALDDTESERVVDLCGVDRLDLGPARLALLAGAPPRYARGDRGFGYDAADLEHLGEQLEEADGLLSWSAPRGGGAHAVDHDAESLALGDAALAERVSAELPGLFAWPRADVGEVVAREESRVSPGDAYRGLRAVVPVLGVLLLDGRGVALPSAPLRVRFRDGAWRYEDSGF